jgi:hypothetical protein
MNLSMMNFYPPFLCRVLAAILKILKTQNCSSNGDISLCQILCFLLLLLFLFLFLFLFFFFLSVHHELVHGRSQELQDRI